MGLTGLTGVPQGVSQGISYGCAALSSKNSDRIFGYCTPVVTPTGFGNPPPPTMSGVLTYGTYENKP